MPQIKWTIKTKQTKPSSFRNFLKRIVAYFFTLSLLHDGNKDKIRIYLIDDSCNFIISLVLKIFKIFPKFHISYLDNLRVCGMCCIMRKLILFCENENLQEFILISHERSLKLLTMYIILAVKNEKLFCVKYREPKIYFFIICRNVRHFVLLLVV